MYKDIFVQPEGSKEENDEMDQISRDMLEQQKRETIKGKPAMKNQAPHHLDHQPTP